MKRWENVVANTTHWLFYVMMIGMPLARYSASAAFR